MFGADPGTDPETDDGPAYTGVVDEVWDDGPTFSGALTTVSLATEVQSIVFTFPLRGGSTFILQH
jgi:hypothetical protein